MPDDVAIWLTITLIALVCAMAIGIVAAIAQVSHRSVRSAARRFADYTADPEDRPG
jgi:ABC-type amino acid transport system permease subunit